MSDKFRAELIEFCKGQEGLVCYIGPESEQDKLLIMDSKLSDTISKTLVFRMQEYMREQFDQHFDDAIDTWRAINAEAKQTEKEQI